MRGDAALLARLRLRQLDPDEVGGSIGVPASASASPAASRAATGANRSRPWNVAETGSSRHGDVEVLIALDHHAEPLGCGDQQAVVGADEQPVVERGAQRDGAPPRADVGVDDLEVDARWGVGEGAREHQRAGEHGLPAGPRARGR